MLTKHKSKATQHTQGSYFFKKNEMPRVGFEPTTPHSTQNTLLQYIV